MDMLFIIILAALVPCSPTPSKCGSLAVPG